MIELPTYRKIGNVFNTLFSSGHKYMLIRGGGGKLLYASYLIIRMLYGGLVHATPPKVIACRCENPTAGVFLFLSVFLPDSVLRLFFRQKINHTYRQIVIFQIISVKQKHVI
jgi:hypothetical protein